MAKTFDAVYENGVFKPLEPVHLVDGVRVGLTLSPPSGPLTEEQIEAALRHTQKIFDGLTEQEIEELESMILERL